MADYGVVHPSGAKTPGGIPFGPRLFGSASSQMPHLTELQTDGTLKNGKVFFDMTSDPGEDPIDGIKVDQKGNYTFQVPADSGLFRLKASTLGQSSPPSTFTTWLGAMKTARLYICAPAVASTGCT